jgi:hypothetical protein
MRRVCVAIFVVFCACLASCMPIQSVGRSIGWVKPKVNDLPKGPDGVIVEVAPLIVPIGDRYANDEIWTTTDEQILPAATRVRLEENGLRVGVVSSGRTPDGLQKLLTSKRSNPDNNSDLFQRTDGGTITCKPLAELPHCEFPLRGDEQPEVKSFDSAKCRFEIVPSVAGEGKVRLVFTPQIEFDDQEKWKRLNPGVALPVQGQRSTESFVSMRWEVVLGLNDYAVVGARFDKRPSLGFLFFVNADSEKPSQRLLAVRAYQLRAGRSGGEAPRSALAAQAAIK